MTTSPDHQNAKTGRTVAIIIAVSALLSVFAPDISKLLGLSSRFEMLLYLFSLAGFIWSLVVTWKLWQKTRDK